MKLSIVTTLYRSEGSIAEFHRRASEAAHRLAGDDFEIVMVNDGSPDRSLQLAVALAEHDPHLVVVDLSRNFGHHKAIMTGLGYARGEHIFLIDSDLEEDPEWLCEFDQQMADHACDVVYGVQKVRKGDWFERWSGALFWSLINRLSDLSLPNNIITARLMSRRYVDALLLHDEREVFLAGLWAITGFDQRSLTVRKRYSGTTTYTLRRKLALLVNSVTSFSNLPLVGVFYVGCLVFILASIYSLYLVINWLFFAQPLMGWTSVMASIWLLGGMMISALGVIGIYLSKVFSEAKRRPYSIVRRVYGQR